MITITLLFLYVTLAFAAPKGPLQENKEDTALYQYIYRDDGYFSWYVDKTEQEGDVMSYWINVTSQRWFDESFSDRPVWWHWLVVHIPVSPRFTESGFLYSSHYSNTNSPPSLDTDHVRRTHTIADKFRLITGVVFQIPNQPIRFVDDNREWDRYEDGLIAWTWEKFMIDERDLPEGGDPEIIARMPMCKGVVKAMDAMTELVAQEESYEIEQFMIAGESKRGWTTWMTGAMDDRVIAMAPVVLSCLDMYNNFQHYYQSFNGWPFYFFDYWIENITTWMPTPEMQVLIQYEDPFSYREWMTMPKMIVSGASDEFFLLDDTHYFFDDLPGEKYFWLLEDTGHSIGSSPRVDDYWDMLGSFCVSVIEEEQRPKLNWTREFTETGGILHIQSEPEPIDIIAFWADSVVENRRDWRKSMLNLSALPDYIEQETHISWTPEEVENLGDGFYQIEMENPEEGFRAFYVQFLFDGQEGDYYFSTETHVIPDGFLYGPCNTTQQCRGVLW